MRRVHLLYWPVFAVLLIGSILLNPPGGSADSNPSAPGSVPAYVEEVVKPRVDKYFGPPGADGLPSSGLYREERQVVEGLAPNAQGGEPNRGTPITEVALNYAMDAIQMELPLQFLQCQGTMPWLWHTYQGLTSEPDVDYGGCSVYIHYKAGPPIGLCVHAEWVVFPCGYFWIFSDMIEYNFPSYKVNVSEQPFQSDYMVDLMVPEYMRENEANYDTIGGMTPMDLSIYAGESQGAQAAFAFPPTEYGSADQAVIDASIAKIKSIDQKYRFVNPERRYMESRIFPEPIDTATLVEYWWIPHVPRDKEFFSDATGNVPLRLLPFGGGYVISKLLLMNFLDANRIGPFLMPGGPGDAPGPFSCARNNKATGKTPMDFESLANGGAVRDIDDWLTSKRDHKEKLDDFNPLNELCLDDVGEAFTYNRIHRLNPTDKIFQAAIKSVMFADATNLNPEERDGSQSSFMMDTYHTFERQWDKWLVLRNDRLKAEIPQCDVIDELAKTNIEYSPNMRKEATKGLQTTFEVWPVYKGCIGLKGWDEDRFDGWPSFLLQYLPSRIPSPGFSPKLRLH